MMTEKGKLVRWIDDKGFGFIKQDNGKDDIFIHISALRGMSRKPIIGDVIHYQTSFDANGKARAVNAKIEGVSQALALAPLARKPKADRPLPDREKPHRNSTTRISKHKKSLTLLPVLLVIGAVFIYDKLSKEKLDSTPVETVAIEPTEQFQCQGKVWCSEMTSYEEAKFYLHNCPNTKMDGDGDGIPCESQF